MKKTLLLSVLCLVFLPMGFARAADLDSIRCEVDYYVGSADWIVAQMVVDSSTNALVYNLAPVEVKIDTAPFTPNDNDGYILVQDSLNRGEVYSAFDVKQVIAIGNWRFQYDVGSGENRILLNVFCRPK
jgi:hypothetical protein